MVESLQMLPKIPILIIEDDHEIRVCFRRILEDYNFNIFSATNGQDALFLLSKLKELPSLIISDINMPIMDGNEFVRAKNNDERLKDIPVLIITAQEEKIKLEGNLPVLLKPLDLNVLVSKVRECTSLRSR